MRYEKVGFGVILLVEIFGVLEYSLLKFSYK